MTLLGELNTGCCYFVLSFDLDLTVVDDIVDPCVPWASVIQSTSQLVAMSVLWQKR